MHLTGYTAIYLHWVKIVIYPLDPGVFFLFLFEHIKIAVFIYTNTSVYYMNFEKYFGYYRIVPYIKFNHHNSSIAIVYGTWSLVLKNNLYLYLCFQENFLTNSAHTRTESVSNYRLSLITTVQFQQRIDHFTFSPKSFASNLKPTIK